MNKFDLCKYKDLLFTIQQIHLNIFTVFCPNISKTIIADKYHQKISIGIGKGPFRQVLTTIAEMTLFNTLKSFHAPLIRSVKKSLQDVENNAAMKFQSM